MKRLLEITVCPLELGSVALPVERGGHPRRMDARAIKKYLERLIRRRGLAGTVWLREECAGGCHRPGPNVNVDVFLKAPPGEEQDHVAVGSKSYVYSLPSVDCLAQIIDENLKPGRSRGTMTISPVRWNSARARSRSSSRGTRSARDRDERQASLSGLC